jgi:hypothetical protein
MIRKVCNAAPLVVGLVVLAPVILSGGLVRGALLLGLTVFFMGPR